MIKFTINYNTTPNEKLLVSGNIDILGNWDPSKSFELNYTHGLWKGDLFLPSQTLGEIQFKFLKAGTMNNYIWEAGANREMRIEAFGEAGVVQYDGTWRGEELAEISYLDRSLFRDVVYRHENEVFDFSTFVAEDHVRVVFRLESGIVAPKHQAVVTGSIPELGEWALDQMLDLNYSDGAFFAEVIVPTQSFPFDYKYAIQDENGDVCMWEDNSNRLCYLNATMPDSGAQMTVFRDDVMSHGNVFRGAGVAVPVFSLRTESGLGVGEFNDLIQFADICSEMGFSILQLLPIYDTNTTGTWVDSYPYSAISVYALHPQYLHLQSMTDDKKILADISKVAADLNSLPKIDYERVMTSKNRFIDTLFDKHWSEVSKTTEYKEFFQNNSHWLIPYSVFCILRDRFNEVDFRQWPEEYRTLSPEEIQEEASKYDDVVSKIYYVQYYLDKQLFEASNYCASKGLGLKGDLPIGVNLRSADAWLYPNLFNLDMSTGAPPDQFSADGQNWGFPTYNWEEMAKDGYKWWRDRLSQMGRYFHAFRIDHILGFFRIWEIPRNYSSGMMGHFYPSHPIHRNEITERFWDIDRLTDPYISWDMLEFHFGQNAGFIAETYMNQKGNRYVLKDFVWDDPKAEDHFNNHYVQADGRPNAEHILRVFSEFRTNVCFLPNHSNSYWEFFPRINMSHSTSFQRLDWESQAFLKELYLDYFYKRQDSMWYDIGMTRLPVIKNASKMLVCGEDLGMVPDCVYPVMNNLSILGLRVQRMPPDPKKEFGFPHEYDYLTVCTPSSHDTSTLREWWEEDRDMTQKFWNQALMNSGPAPQFANESIIGNIIEQHLGSPAMWAIFPIQEFFGIFPDLRVEDPSFERINIPAIPKHYWRYRMHVTLDDLQNHPHFVPSIRNMLDRNNRRN